MTKDIIVTFKTGTTTKDVKMKEGQIWLYSDEYDFDDDLVVTETSDLCFEDWKDHAGLHGFEDLEEDDKYWLSDGCSVYGIKSDVNLDMWLLLYEEKVLAIAELDD